MTKLQPIAVGMLVLAMLVPAAASAQIAVKAETLHTAAGPTITDGVVVIDAQGKIEAVGPAASTPIPDDYEIIECAVTTPGLVDVRATAGLTGIFNVDHDQDMLERSSPLQPQLRAFDAYNTRDKLVGYIRSFGVTTIHTGHAPGELVTGRTVIVKTAGDTMEDVTVRADAAVTATLGAQAIKGGGKSPGTRGKQVAMLRDRLIKAQEYAAKWERWESKQNDADEDATDDGDADAKPGSPPARDLAMEALAAVLNGETPMIITAHRAQDIATALRLAEEFGFTLWLDGAAEAYLFTDELADTPVLLHPTMARAVGEASNQSYETAKLLSDAGVTFAIQSGYEPYVPKVRVVLFEAGVAAGYGSLGFDRALRSITIDAARILGIDDRVGSLEVGKDGDVAMYSGDPFEYTTHCLGAIIEGQRFVGEKDYQIGYP
ncbi:MAG: amidohydrolase family protein [Planctomycetota bacterium]